jgi:hypothetical protein
MTMFRLITIICTLLISSAAVADVGAGLNVGYVFGHGITVGVRATSSKKEDKVIGSLGVDYNFSEKAFRPLVGIGYTAKDSNVELNVGRTNGAFDFGASVGYLNTEEDKPGLLPCPPGSSRNSSGTCASD